MRLIHCVYIVGLYRKGLVYLDVPISDDDHIVGKVRLLQGNYKDIYKN